MKSAIANRTTSLVCEGYYKYIIRISADHINTIMFIYTWPSCSFLIGLIKESKTESYKVTSNTKLKIVYSHD